MTHCKRWQWQEAAVVRVMRCQFVKPKARPEVEFLQAVRSTSYSFKHERVRIYLYPKGSTSYTSRTCRRAEKMVVAVERVSNFTIFRIFFGPAPYNYLATYLQFIDKESIQQQGSTFVIDFMLGLAFLSLSFLISTHL